MSNKDYDDLENLAYKSIYPIIAIAIVVIIFGLPPLFYFIFKLYGINYEYASSIGDTIGGLSSPFINLIAAIAVIYTLLEQRKAIDEAKELDYLRESLSKFEAYCREFEYYSADANRIWQGKIAFVKYYEDKLNYLLEKKLGIEPESGKYISVCDLEMGNIFIEANIFVEILSKTNRKKATMF